MSLIVYLLPTLIAAWIGWRWRKWRGVFIATIGLWMVLSIAGILFLSVSEEKIRMILEASPS